MKNFVVVRHLNDSGRYLFYVPDDVTLEAGTGVICETRQSHSEPGVCVTGTFTANPEIICPLWGTQPKSMKRVVKVLREFILPWPEGTETEQGDDDE